jgi:uncharacterized protein (DUF1501 family)
MHSPASRREFLRRAGAFSAFGAAAPWALNLAATAAASAQQPGDYRALVCIFMYGGNDNHNTVVPYDVANYNLYAGIRGNIDPLRSIALPRAELAATQIVPTLPWTNNRQMALHPALLPLKTLFDQGRLAVAMNVGTLLREGTTLADYKAGIGLPPKLFSHNDQQSVWQSSLAEGARSGWGGRMGDLLASSNDDAIFTSISAGGNAVFMSGNQVVQYQVSGAGSVQINPVFESTASTDALKRLMQRTNAHLFEEEHAVIARRSIAADAKVRAALANGPDMPPFPTTPLGAQLKIVARLIAARQALGVRRQVFFVSQGGFDNHDFLITKHPGLLDSVAGAMKAFYTATEVLGVANRVTTFTGSDFGRTLANNGDGSDHGWGSHHFVMGGAVKPKAWVGKVPAVSLAEGPDNVGGGRLLPAIGVDQYGATLARWMGVTDSQLATVLPNIVEYTTRDLGFMT